MPKLRIFLADDHVVVRAGLKTLINAEPDMEVIGEAQNGQQAVDRIGLNLPDVAVLDVSMPELNGPAATRLLKRNHPQLKVLALTVHEDRTYLRESLTAGASGYVLKRAAAEELIRAIRTVARGEVFVDSRVAAALVSSFVEPNARRIGSSAQLSERETEVMRLIAQGYTTKEVARDLGVSSKTIETHKMRSMEKLQLRNRVDIVRAAAERGWLHAP